MTDFSKGDQVEWHWGQGTASGKVKERFTDEVTRTIKGSEITRHASKDDPAYLLEQDDGGEVLKSGSELSKASGGSGSSSGGGSDEPTKAELYEKAKDEGVDGRSKMDKGELKDAVGD